MKKNMQKKLSKKYKKQLKKTIKQKRQNKRKTHKKYGGDTGCSELNKLNKLIFGKSDIEKKADMYYIEREQALPVLSDLTYNKLPNNQQDQPVLSDLTNRLKLCENINKENPNSQFINKSNLIFNPFFIYTTGNTYILKDFILMFQPYTMNTNVNFGIQVNNLYEKSYTNLGYYLGYSISEINKYNNTITVHLYFSNCLNYVYTFSMKNDKLIIMQTHQSPRGRAFQNIFITSNEVETNNNNFTIIRDDEDVNDFS